MTPNLLDELSKIVALSEKATPGEWRYFPKPKYNEHHVSVPSEASSFHIGLFPDGCPTDRPAADAELMAASVNFLRTHRTTLADMAKRLETLQSLAAAMYQAAGAYDMPVRFLDVLSAAGNGEPITEEQVDALLPCETPDTLQRLEAAERDRRLLDWLSDPNQCSGQVLLPTASVEANLHNMRAAIEHAMNASKEATQGGEG